MTDRHSVIALLDPIGVALEVTSSRAALDEGWSPYCQTTLTCKMPSSEDRALIDIRDTQLRLDLRLRQDFGAPTTLAAITADIGGSIANLTALLEGEPLGALTNRYHVPWNGSLVRSSQRRLFDLYVTSRSFDDLEQTLTIIATSDESQLLGDALISETPVDPGTTSLKDICAQVLSRYGAMLSTASLDATVAEAAATIWQPGVSAWRYLNPMLEAASLRLWCDELGVWLISERESSTPGAFTLAPTETMTGLVDTMSLDPDVWYDAVVVEYQWNDDLGASQVAYDVAGPNPAKSVLHVRRDTRYPGPGAAAGILNRASGRGRVLDLAAISDYRLTPGMAASISPIAAETQTGYLASVVWKYPADEMDVATRGLVDTPETAYIFGAPGVSYLDVDAGIDYLEFEWSMT